MHIQNIPVGYNSGEQEETTGFAEQGAAMCVK